MDRRTMLRAGFAMAVAFAFTCSAQDGMSYVPGADPPAARSKAEARDRYFWQRLTFPDGSVPPGALVKAYRDVLERLPLYAPSGHAAAPSGHAVVPEQVWKNRGPFNVGGRIYALAVNPKNPRTMLVGAANGGIWRSLDGARSWHSVSDELPVQSIGSIVFNPVDTGVIYAGSGDASFGWPSFDGGGLYKSTDGGSTWNEIGSGTLPAYARACDMAINPLNPDILYIAIPEGPRSESDNGIWRSTDAGATWTRILEGLMTDILIDPLHPSILYTVSSKIFSTRTVPRTGVLRSVDGGDTWTTLAIGTVDSLIGRTGMAICAGNPERLYISVSELGELGYALRGIYKSTDAGASWTPCPVPFDYMKGLGWFANVIAVHPANPDIVYAGSVKLIRSTDGGATWTRMPDQLAGGIIHVDQHEIEFNPADPSIVYVGNDGGLYTGTRDGETWAKTDDGLAITQFIGGAMHPASDALLIGGTQDNGTLLSAGSTSFDLTLYGDGGNGFINPQRPNIMFTSQENLKLWRSDDGGVTWSWAVGNLPNDQCQFYVPYAMDMQHPSTLYVGTYRMYKTADDGRSWTQLQSCLLPTGTGSCYFITATSVAPYDSRTVLAGGAGHVAVSLDAGATWAVHAGQLPVAFISSLRSFSANTLYATIARYGVAKVWRSTNLGNDWTDISGNLPDIPVNDIMDLGGALVIGTDLGAFVSTDGGAAWQRLGTGMPPVSVQKLLYHNATGTLRAVTHGRGFFDLQWTVPPAAAPLFVSTPDASDLDLRQTFVYAPVTSGYPPASYSLREAPAGATIDAAFGTVRWTAREGGGRFTIEATNAGGTVSQTFTLAVKPAATAYWEVTSAERLPAMVNDMRAGADGSLWMARDTGWVSRSLDGGATWEHMKLPTDASVIGLFAFDQDLAYAGTGGPQSLMNTGAGHIFATTNGGLDWQPLLYGIDARFGNIHFWNMSDGIAVSQGARDSADVYLTADGGATWELVVPRPFARIPLYGTLVFPSRTNGFFASSNEYASPAGDASILRTTDGGRTWLARSAGSGIRFISDISFHTEFRGYCVDEMSGKLRRTQSGGNTWSTTFYPMNGLRNVAVHAVPQSQTVWVVSDTSAWVSTNEGSTWMRTPLVPAGAMQTAVFTDSAHGWAVSKNGIVQRLRFSPAVSVHPADAAPAKLELGAAFPNPVPAAAGACAIPLRLSAASQVTVTAHNSMGREIGRLFEGELPAGEHVVGWEIGGLAAGTYFFTVTSGSERRVGRITVMQ